MVFLKAALSGFGLLLPALVPSWRFFAAVAPSPRVEFKTGLQDHWQAFRPIPQHLPPASMIGRLFWNREWNEHLYLVSCAERLIAKPTVHSETEIASRIAKELLLRPSEFHFRLVFVTREGQTIKRTTAFLSRCHKAI